jgi:hypothetical protein
VWDQPLDQTIEVDRYITERLSHWFPDSASYISLGNHGKATHDEVTRSQS